MKITPHWYNTFRTQIEILPRISVVYGKNVDDSDIEKNGIAFEWLWFNVFFEIN